MNEEERQMKKHPNDGCELPPLKGWGFLLHHVYA